MGNNNKPMSMAEFCELRDIPRLTFWRRCKSDATQEAEKKQRRVRYATMSDETKEAERKQKRVRLISKSLTTCVEEEVFASQLLNARSKHRSPARTRTRHRQSSLLNASDEDTSPTKLSFLNASRTRRHARHPRCQHLLMFTRQLHLLNSFRRTSPPPSRRG